MNLSFTTVAFRSGLLFLVLMGVFFLSLTQGVFSIDWTRVWNGETGTGDWEVFMSRLTRSGLAIAVGSQGNGRLV